MAAKYLSNSKTLTALLLLPWLGRVVAAQPSPEAANPVSIDNYDQIIAQMPLNRAAIASVALAELNIALHQAKNRAEQTLCQGNWTPSGEVVQQIGPLVVAKTAAPKIWLYQSLRRAHPLACDRVSRAQFFLEMSRHLPAWVSIRPAGQIVSFSEGLVQPLPPSYLATR